MQTLTSLPIELQLRIISNIPPGRDNSGYSSLRLVSRHLSLLAYTFQFRLFRSINNSRHARQYLKILKKAPELAKFTRTAVLGFGMRSLYLSSNADIAEDLQVWKELDSIPRKLLCPLEETTEDPPSLFHAHRLYENVAPFVLLFRLAPNLRHLEVSTFQNLASTTVELAALYEGLKFPVLETILWGYVGPRLRFNRNLYVALLNVLCGAPNLKVLEASLLDFYDPKALYMGFSDRFPTSITELDFKDCRISLEFIEMVFTHTKHLKSFKYSFMHLPQEDGFWRALWIVRNTLEILDLVPLQQIIYFRVEKSYIGPLNEFRCLKRLYVPLQFLLPEGGRFRRDWIVDEDLLQGVVEILPKGLQQLQLQRQGRLIGVEDVENMAKRLLEKLRDRDAQ